VGMGMGLGWRLPEQGAKLLAGRSQKANWPGLDNIILWSHFYCAKESS